MSVSMCMHIISCFYLVSKPVCNLNEITSELLYMCVLIAPGGDQNR